MSDDQKSKSNDVGLSITDRIAQVVSQHYLYGLDADYVGLPGSYKCWCGDRFALLDEFSAHVAAAIVAELNFPDRTFIDDHGRTWWWCGGKPGTWAWRLTDLDEHRPKTSLELAAERIVALEKYVNKLHYLYYRIAMCEQRLDGCDGRCAVGECSCPYYDDPWEQRADDEKQEWAADE